MTSPPLSLAVLAVLAVPVTAQEYLPTPYTAEQIREAWHEGRTVTLRMDTPEGVTVSRTTVVGWSAEEATVSEQRLDVEGEPLGEPVVSTSRWEDLRDHARFPAATTSRERRTLETPLGDLEGWLYTVDEAERGRSRFFFADAYPGPPVLFDHSLEGETTFEAVQTENLAPSTGG